MNPSAHRTPEALSHPKGERPMVGTIKPAAVAAILGLGLTLVGAPSQSEPARDAILATFAAEAKKADPAFAGFSAERGQAFWEAKHTGGKPDTPSCTSCHSSDPTAPGETRAGKRIEPGAELGRADHAAAEFHHHRVRGNDTRHGRACPACAGSKRTFDTGQPRDRRRTISTPTAPGSFSSFSIFTLTEAARGCARQRVAISSASVSTRLI